MYIIYAVILDFFIGMLVYSNKDTLKKVNCINQLFHYTC